uniref:Uncharacterized protein n=1 Tax=Ditylum brightwellii TaxID=49249 RepID=A0A7S4SC01_9STRA|mmetsp:Transcript_55612/g.82713  ORF Transcript_55612/g.82713 Transcript_55612/m.82713 type:complete len:463 (-) Transcript_55612:235-1623(-)
MQTASSLMMDNTQNDGIAASTSKQEFRPEDTLAAGPFGSNDSSLSNKKQTASEKEINEAKEEVTELVASLLALSGAPAFVEEYYGEENASSKYEFVGFDPSRVPPNLLSQPSSSGSASAASKALRTGEKDGQVLLQSILSDFEMRAIGHDGMAADNKKRGGGHYTEVRKVGAFLEGYRRAEVKRISRETITMLLDRLVTDGVKGLDEMLVGMTKGGSSRTEGGGFVAGESGELNDSLVNYLNEAIRTQEKKVQQLIGDRPTEAPMPTAAAIRNKDEEDSKANSLWNVTTNEETGEIIESIDPNDPNVKKALFDELENKNSDNNAITRDSGFTKTAPEVLLTLLTLLRDRIKAEAAFEGSDEKGRNLRVLAYCLRAESDPAREKIVRDYLGTSMDALDSFLELIESSIEYTEDNSSNILRPSSGNSLLNLGLLKQIKDMVEDMKDRMAWKASGISSTDGNSWQ